LAGTANRLAWALGGRSKRAGDALAAMDARLLAANPRHRLALARQTVQSHARQLEAMSYRSALARGFSVTRGRDGAIIRSVAQAAMGDRIETELADGTLPSRVEDGPAPATAPVRTRTNRKAAESGPTLFDWPPEAPT